MSHDFPPARQPRTTELQRQGLQRNELNRRCTISPLKRNSLEPVLVSSAAIIPLLSNSYVCAQSIGLESTVEYSAPWPPWVTILFVAAAAFFTYGLYYREKTEFRSWVKFALATLRFGLICIVLWMMYGYTTRPFRTDLPDLLLVVDTSQSMTTIDAENVSPASEDANGSDSSVSTLTADLKQLELSTATRLNQSKAVLLRDDAKLTRFFEENYQTKLVTLDAAGGNDSRANDSVGNSSSGNDSESSEESKTPLDSNVQKSNDANNKATRPGLQQDILKLSATSSSSKLGTTLRQALQRQRGRPVAAVVYLTDGITTDGPPLSEIGVEAKQRDIPLHIVGLGSQLPSRDLRVSDLLVDDIVFVGDLVTFDLTLSGDGYKDEEIEVTLRPSEDSPDSLSSMEPISQRVTLTANNDSQPVRLAFKAEEEGTFHFIIETKPREGEASADNNAVQATVQVRDEVTRVLLVQSYPSYEYHYLKTLLERQQKSVPDVAKGNSNNPGSEIVGGSVELSVLLQDADPEFVDIDPAIIRNFPTRNDLFEYDVCIFGDVNPTLLGNEALLNLRDFVRERGRGFVGIAGPRYMPSAYTDTPLAEILPFNIRSTLTPPADLPIEKGYRPNLTPLGRRMPCMQLAPKRDTNDAIWAQLPELYWLLEVDSTKPGTRVLAEHPTRTNTSGRPLPITTLSYVGAGKVLFQNTDDTWRWRIGRGDEFFARYWQQSIRYLSRFKLGEGRDIELTSDREQYNRGDIVRLRARFFDERRAPDDARKVVVTVEQKGHGKRRVTLQRDGTDRGIFTADVANLGTGDYHAWLAEPTTNGQAPATDFQVTTPNAEMTRLEMDATDLQRAAEISDGKFYTVETAGNLLDNLPVGKQVRIEPLPPEPMWNSWKVALLFVALLIVEWLSRRQVGMV